MSLANDKILNRVRGFPDQLEEESARLDSLLSAILDVLSRFGFERVNPPILESRRLFVRALGEGSDIVHKEIYSLQPAEESLALRPEGTAGIARMLISNKLFKSLPLKWHYYGPMFRRERPQKGRFRQFHQLGAELLGDPSEEADVELLSLAWLLIKKLGIEGTALLEINSLGSLEERRAYKIQLKKFLSPLKAKLSPDSQIRFEKNPLRIWDSKEESDREIMRQAPLLRDSLQPSSLKRWERIKELLSFLNIPFKENPRLVRGLDYYNDLVFECSSPKLGAQSAFLAGGRYDGLAESLGGPPVASAGWALGLERLSLLTGHFKKEKSQIGLLSVGKEAETSAFRLAYKLRAGGWKVFYRFSGNFSKQMKRISQKCLLALIYGEREYAKKTIILKNLESEEQKAVPLTELEKELRQFFSPKKP